MYSGYHWKVYTLSKVKYIDRVSLNQDYIHTKVLLCCFFKYCSKRHSLGFLHELLFVSTPQETAKLWPVKVGGSKKLPHASPFYLVYFFRSQILTSHSFAAPWAMMMSGSSFESPKSYLSGKYFKKSIHTITFKVRKPGTLFVLY